MAIDLIVKDGVDSGISSKLEAIGRAAGFANDRAAALQKSLGKVNADALRSLSRAQLDQSKYNVNQAKADYYNTKASIAKEQQIAEKIKQAGLATKNAQENARQIELTARQKELGAEKVAQERIRTANAQVAAKTAQAEAAARQADAARKAAYSNELTKYAPSMAASTAAVAQGKADVSGAATAAANAKAAAAATQAQLAQAKLNTETAKAANINAKTALSEQNLATAAERTAIAQTNLAAATSRATAAHVRSQNAVTRSQTSLAAFLGTLSGVNNATTRAVTGLNNTSSAMSKLETSASFLRSDGLRWAKVLWALGGATLTAHAIVSAADAYTRLQNRLSIVAESQAHVNKLTEEVGRIAISSRQPLEATGKLYARLDLAMRDLGESQQTTGKLTEAISKGLQLTGATAGEAASAMLQLSQAFNKGKLDGDEFRTMMEGAPILADELAKSLGVTRGQLLKLAPEGKITAQAMTKAWVEALPRIRKAFDDTRTTIEQGFNIFRTEMTLYLGELDKSIGFTNALSKAIVALGDNLDTLTFILLAITPIAAAFIGTKMIAGMAAFAGYATRTAVAIGSIRSPITVVAAGLAGLTRSAVTSGAAMVTAFTNANTRAIALQLSVARLSAGMLALSNVATRVGSAMLAAFSFGNIILLLGVATAAAIAFGDQMIVNAQKGTTMRDYTIAAFSVMADYVKVAFNDTFDYIHDGFDDTGKKAESTGERVLISAGAIADGTATLVDSVLTLFNWLGQGIATAVTAVLETIQNMAKSVANIIISVINAALLGINTMTQAASSAAQFAARIGNMFGGSFDENAGIEQIGYIDKLTLSYEGTAAAAAKLNSEQELGVTIAQRSLAQFRKDVAARAEAIAKTNSTNANLRGNDPAKQAAAAKAAEEAAKYKDKKKGKTDEEKRATMIQKVIDEQTRLTAEARRYGDERERIAIVEKLNDDITRKGYAALLPAERERISNLVQQRIEAERVGKALQSMYEAVKSPRQEYTAANTALDQLRKEGQLNAQQYELLKYNIEDTFQSATDAAYTYKKELDSTRRTFGLFGEDAAAAQAKWAALEDAAKTGKLYDAAAIDEMARANYRLQQQQSALNDLWSSGAGQLEKLRYAQEALNKARASGQISQQYGTIQGAGNLAQQGTINEQLNGIQNPFEPMQRGLYQLVAEMPMLGQAMADAIQGTLGNAIDNVSNTLSEMVLNFDAYAESVEEALGKPVSTLDVLRYAIGDIVKQIGTDLIKALIKMGAQWAVQAALQQSIQSSLAASSQATQAAVTASSATMAATLQTAWSGAAVTASIATMGGAATTGLTAYGAALAAGKLMSAIPALADGGYVSGAGTSRSDSILARIANGEMVMNAGAVERNRPMLDALNSGASISSGTVNNTNIIINYNGSSKSEMQATGDKQFANELRDFVDSRINARENERQQQGHSGYRVNGY